MELEARGMRRLGLSFSLILSSPLLRARQTARIVAERFGIDGALRICDEAGPGCRLPGLVSAVAREAAVASRDPAVLDVLVVGHQPDMGRLVKDLSGAHDPPAFGRGTLACFEIPAWPPASPCPPLFLMPAEELEKRGSSWSA